MFVAAETREDTASQTTKQKFFRGHRGNLCVKEFRLDSPTNEISGYER